MSRKYTASFVQVTVSAVQDLISVLAPAGAVVRILSCRLSQSGTSTDARQRVRFKRLTAGHTVGSGGGAMTPTKMETGDAVAASTVRINDTTQAITSGSALTVYEDVFSLLSGWFDVPVPEEVRVVAPGEKFVLDFPAIATSGLAWNGSVVFEEIG